MAAAASAATLGPQASEQSAALATAATVAAGMTAVTAVTARDDLATAIAGGRLIATQQSDADDRQKDGQTQNNDPIHPNSPVHTDKGEQVAATRPAIKEGTVICDFNVCVKTPNYAV